MDPLVRHTSSGSVPTSPTGDLKMTELQVADVKGGRQIGTADARTIKLEMLREQLRAAKIPLTKRASLSELPQSAEDCSFIAGTTRCALPLCEDSCVQPHRHHRTHARPSKPNAPLVYSRPSISMLPGSGLTSGLASGAVSSFGSPADSPAASQTNSPQHQYRRASGFGFNFGARGSVISTTSGFTGPMSGGATPADMASGPPSPLSDSFPGSAATSAPTSPRHHAVGSGSAFSTTEFCQPIAEEKEVQLAPSTSSELVQEPTSSEGLATDYWKLGKHIVNLNDYAPSVVGCGTMESRTRLDLAAAPRDDCPDQVHSSWDPRSPQPPSPVEFLHAQVLRVNMNQQDRTKPELEYELAPTSIHKAPRRFDFHTRMRELVVPEYKFSNLHMQIEEISSIMGPNPKDDLIRRGVSKRVSETVWELWPDAEVHIIGSCATNLFLPDSDIDLVIRDPHGKPKLDARP